MLLVTSVLTELEMTLTFIYDRSGRVFPHNKWKHIKLKYAK